METQPRAFAFSAIFAMVATCIAAGAFIGATTNMINGLVSADYFRNVMGWDFEEIGFAAIAQGVFEGLIYGVFFAAIFTTGLGVVTKGKAGYQFGLLQLLKLVALVYCFWILGGIAGIFLANLSPEFYRGHFPFAPADHLALLRFAWVGGSIWGGLIGGFLTAVFSVALIRDNWKSVYSVD